MNAPARCIRCPAFVLLAVLKQVQLQHAVADLSFDAECISLGRVIWCQHGAFSGVGAVVASFVPAECPKGGGVCGVYSESP